MLPHNGHGCSRGMRGQCELGRAGGGREAGVIAASHAIGRGVGRRMQNASCSIKRRGSSSSSSSGWALENDRPRRPRYQCV
jgi:hypothetical protein